MTLTTRRTAAVAVLVGMVAGYLVIGAFDLSERPIPFTPWSLPIMTTILAGASLAYAVVLRRQVVQDRANLDPDAAVRALVLGKTLVAAGLILAGAETSQVLRFIGEWSVPGPRERAVRALVTLVTAVAMAVAGSRLERACVVPDSGDDEDQPTP